MLDGWSIWPFDLERGGRQAIPVYNTSTRWDGTDGPLGRLEEIFLEAGQEVDRERLLLHLSESGYDATTMVQGPGDYSVRGGISSNTCR